LTRDIEAKVNRLPYVLKESVESSISPEIEEEIENAFNGFDKDKSGEIDGKELKVAFKAMGFNPTRK
jgi:Ca2+-binding EF-hand superfamily protein